MEDAAFLDAVEYQLMEGGARWVADFAESIRRVRIADMDFDMVVKGSTRGRSGYFLSAITSKVITPDYSVACFVKAAGSGGWDEKGISRALAAAGKFLWKHKLTWVWLVLTQQGELNKAAARTVQSFEEKEVGIALVNLENQKSVRSDNLLGRNVYRIMPRGRKQAISKGSGVKPGRRAPLQVRYLAGLFGGFLILAMIATGGGIFFATGRFIIPPPYFVADMVGAAAFAYLFYNRLLHVGFSFDDEKLRLVEGTGRFVEARWADYDMVSLFHIGGGKYHLSLYRRDDHSKILDIPASSVRLDPLAFRWKAMELTAHGKEELPSL